MSTKAVLAGQKALVMGANSGIGEAVAIAMGQAGANVAVNSTEARVAGMFADAVKQLGTVDILVANAGLQCDQAFHEMTLERWNTVISVNLTHPGFSTGG